MIFYSSPCYKRLFNQIGAKFVTAAVLTAGALTEANAQITIQPNVTNPGTSCFDGQSALPYAHDIGLSTVLLISVDAHGRPYDSGTGEIIANSRGSDAHNRILTVAHIFDIKKESYETAHDPVNTVTVVRSDGTVLGTGVPVVIASTDLSKSDRGDMAVLKFIPSNEDTARLYDAAHGVTIAHIQARSDFLSGSIAKPSNAASGASGGMLLDDNEEMIGMLAEGHNASEKTVSLTLPRLYDNKTHIVTGKPTDKVTYIASAGGDIYAESIINPEILVALNDAGKDIASSPIKPTHATMFGMPHGYCEVFETNVSELNATNRSNFLPPSMVGKETIFKDWDDDQKSMTYMKSLLERLRQDRPPSGMLDGIIKQHAAATKLSEIDSVTLGVVLDDYVDGVKDPQLQNELMEAVGECIATGAQRSKLAPKAPSFVPKMIR